MISLGNIASGYILLPDEAARHYPTTFKIVIGVMAATIGLALLLAFIMYRDNMRHSRLQQSRQQGQVIDKDGVTDRLNVCFRYFL